MLVRKFYASSSRHALRLVREALGGEALILSNRRTANGIEIMAVAPQEVEAVTQTALPAHAGPPAVPGDASAGASAQPASVGATGEPDSTPSTAPLHDSAQRHYDAGQYDPTQRDPAHSYPAHQDPIQQYSAHQDPAPYDPAPYDPAPYDPTPYDPAHYDPAHYGPAPYDLVHEVRLLRSLLEGQLSAFAWGDLKRRDPAKGEVMRRLLGAGFSAGLSREVIGELPDGLDLARAMRLMKAGLQQRLRTAALDAGLVDDGGIIALVGPTGVGKTTTVAKLAAECTIRHGAAKLALVTTDTYRIGAVDQLRIYGKILGVPVFAIRNESDLRATLEELHSRHLVLIDTVGMSQRDRRLADQVALLSGCTRRVRRVLLLSAVSQANVLEDVVRAYRGDDLAGCILTKVDEALTLGAPLDALARHGLTLHYVANGQRVPEDLHQPNTLYLIERAFRDGSQAGGVEDGDVPLTLAAGQN
jgi:flagellar biosynthesis protein FlhF